MENDLKSNILRALGLGFHLFPIRHNSKLPLRGVSWKNLITRQEQIVKTCLSENLNYAIATEFYKESEALLVVDIDNKETEVGNRSVAELEIEGFDFPETLEQTTPNGGRHLFYRIPTSVAPSVGKIASGIDIRSRGSYVVGFGSRIDGRVYKLISREISVAPEWLVERCRRFIVEPQQPINNERQVSVNQDSALIRAISYLQSKECPIAVAGSGGNDTTYKVATKLKDFGLNPIQTFESMYEFWNWKCEPPWNSSELLKIIENAFSYGQNATGVRSAEADFKPVGQSPAPENKKRSLTIKKFKHIKPNFDQPFLVDRLLSPGAMSVVYGESNSGKTFFALDMGLHISLGQEWMGRKVEQGLVVYVAAEGGWGIQKRIEAFRQYHKLQEKDVPFSLVPSSIDLLNPKTHVQELINLVGQEAKDYNVKPALLVIDTLSRAIAGGNENAAEDMGAFVSNIDALRSNTNAHLLVIHHSGKDVAKGARGHSSLRAATDTELEIDDNRCRVTKQRDMDFGPEIGFKLETVNIGTNKNGDNVTSCVVLPSNTSATNDFSKEPLDPESVAGRGMAALIRALDWHGQAALTEMDLPEDKLIVNIDAWRKEFIEHFYSGSQKSTRSMAFTRATNELLAMNRIAKTTDFVWIS